MSTEPHGGALLDRYPGAAKSAALRRGSEHFVQFYEQDDALVEAVTGFLRTGLESGGAAIVVAAPHHRTPLAHRLGERGVDVARLEGESRFFALDAAQTLARLVVDGKPVAARFAEILDPLLDAASAGGRRPVRVFGEMVALLWGDGRREAAVLLEKMWNELGRRHAFSLFCAYPMNAFARESDVSAFLEVCGEHGHAVPCESFTGLDRPEDRLSLISQLQQKALALESEVARRKGLEEMIRRREKEMSDCLESAQEGVVEVESDGSVRCANASLLALLGRERSTVSGRSLVEFLVDRGVFHDVWAKLLRGEAVRDVPADFRRPDGSVVHARVASANLRVLDQSVHMRWFVRRACETCNSPSATAPAAPANGHAH